MVYLEGIITINVSLLRQFSAPYVSFVCHKLEVNHFCDYLMPHLYHLFCFCCKFQVNYVNFDCVSHCGNMHKNFLRYFRPNRHFDWYHHNIQNAIKISLNDP